MCITRKLERKKLYSKLWEYKKQSSEKKLSNKDYVLDSLKIIEDELKKYKPIKDDNFVFGARQKFCLEEFEKYIKEGNISDAYYDLEDFIGHQWIPVDAMNGLKETKYICTREVEKIQYMLQILKKKYKQELEKELVLEIRHANWGEIGPDDWTSIVWKIYKDLTVDIEKLYNRTEQNIENISKKLTQKDYDSILKNIELSKENSVVVEACDGSAWEMIQYENGKEMWKKELGYIYGIKSLEDVAKIVNKLL